MKAPRHPPAYSVAAQMARLHRLGRAHSHEGVTSAASVDTFYMENGEEEDGKYDKTYVKFNGRLFNTEVILEISVLIAGSLMGSGKSILFVCVLLL